jgi:hypothetical protein
VSVPDDASTSATSNDGTDVEAWLARFDPPPVYVVEQAKTTNPSAPRAVPDPIPQVDPWWLFPLVLILTAAMATAFCYGLYWLAQR